jgi:putative membrane protein
MIGLVAAAVSLVCVVPAPPARAFVAGEASDADKAFVGKVSQGGMYEVEASKVAAMRATAPNVKDQALTEVHDHEGVNLRLKAIAAKTGVPVSTALNAEFQARLAKLKAAPAADFDQAYITDMQQIHDKDEKLFAQEAQEGSDAYKDFAHQTDLIVKRHIGALNAPGTI